MRDFFQIKKKQLYEWIEGLSNKQKLLYSVIFVCVLIFLVKVIFGKILRPDEGIIKYEKSMSGNDIHLISYDIDDNDLFIQIKNAVDNYIDLCSEKKYDNEGKLIKLNRVYKEALYDNYKKFISRSKFKSEVKEVLDAVEKIKSVNNNELNPTDVSQYRENAYIVEYSYSINSDEEVTLWLGITLDKINGLYYVWYMEVE